MEEERTLRLVSPQKETMLAPEQLDELLYNKKEEIKYYFTKQRRITHAHPLLCPSRTDHLECGK